jgi:pSer/pThr/pTyr-binding forkhead associated (FHA) protein
METIAVPLGKAIILGREHASNRHQPKVNLTRYTGLSKGISRRHATIRHDANGWWIIDLGSSNGAWLGRERLAPRVPYCLSKVNDVRLGRLDFRIVVLGPDC